MPRGIRNKTKKTDINDSEAFNDAMINDDSDSESKYGINFGGQDTSTEEQGKYEDYEDDEIEDEDDLNDNVEVDVEDDDTSINEASKCLYKYADDKSDEEFDDFYDDENEKPTKAIYVSDDERITKPFLFKYERVRLLGIRTRQLALGAKPMIKNSDNLSSKEIAELEIKFNVIPLKIVRPLPNGKKEKWKISELKKME